MKIRFLLDENLSPRHKNALWHYDAGIDVARVSDSEAPPLETLDPDILIFYEVEQRLLVTDTRISMPVHVRDHYALGRQHWGVFRTRRRLSIGDLASKLYLFGKPAMPRNGAIAWSGSRISSIPARPLGLVGGSSYQPKRAWAHLRQILAKQCIIRSVFLGGERATTN